MVAAYQDTRVIASVARTLGLSGSAVRRYVRAQAAGTPLAPVHPKGRTRLLGVDTHAALLDQVQHHADAPLAEHAELWSHQTGQRVRVMTVQRMFARLGITRKKRRSTPASSPNRSAKP